MRRPLLLKFFLLVVIFWLFVQPWAVRAQGENSRGEVDDLLAALAGDDLLAQEKAAQQLAVLAPTDAVPQLTQIFSTSATPRLAATVLAAIGTPVAMNVLMTALGDEKLTARRNAAQIALTQAGDRAVPFLLEGLQASDASLRHNSALMLGYIGSPQTIGPLLRIARNDEDPNIRREAVWALSEIGGVRVRLALMAIARTDPDKTVRDEAEHALFRGRGEF